MISSFKDLLVWQEAMNLVVMIYQITSHFPRYEIFALTSQMNRAATSIPANISEGNGRYSTNDYLRFLSIANGSLRELETHLLIAERLNYVKRTQTEETFLKIEYVGKLLNGLRKSLENQSCSD
ncbi:MAG: four helix bundle protein [Thermoguttaceae bacterium]|nr:four helix bundle protein [Thermoguttaceae bacterium]